MSGGTSGGLVPATRRERAEPARMSSSVEAPMWRALRGYRVLTAGYAVALFVVNYHAYDHRPVAVAYLTALVAWTLATLRAVSSAERCTPRFLAVDLAVGVVGILLSPLTDPGDAISPTLPSIWMAGSVLAVALRGGWRWAACASCVVGAANLVQAGHLSRSTLHNVLLVCVASIAVGYVIELARASERTLARALRIEAATRERERLARDIHDSVLQVLAMVQRRGAAVGGEAAELGRLAGEQERALRALVAGGPPSRLGAAGEGPPGEAPTGADGARDVGALLALAARGGSVVAAAPAGTATAPGTASGAGAPTASGVGELTRRQRVTYAGPPGPVPLPHHAARELAAAVAAALDNVRRHAPDAQAWILLEDEPEQVLVTVRDDGPGIAEGRLAEAEAEGRLGVAQSIRGRLAALGGSAAWVSVPGQGTEVELRLPKEGGRG
ncbi:MacS family sensor histidine kinase [Streptomyces sp. 4N509B]|uniref:MacS family sensor histidine kinase n=1 Tax=Streptomyces sp. 4N509B TaxID=3457413 RepID=UPI003FD54A22